MFLLNKIISNLKIKGFPKVLTPHEKSITAEALEEYFEKYERANDNTKRLCENGRKSICLFCTAT